ncbi:MAG: L-threonylcarbamoyladenylate synthase [Rhizomicrobium sp.]
MTSSAFDEQVQRVVASLSSGGVALLPTDTVYGLAAVPTMSAAVDRIFALKRRPPEVNLPIMVSSIAELEGLGLALDGGAHRLLHSPLVPGALTIALGFRGTAAVDWLRDRDEVAIRIPNDRRLLEILRRIGPLLMTSANAHGNAAGEDVPEILAQLSGMPDVVIDGGTLPRVPSTLVNCRKTPPQIEREGVIPRSEVEKYLADA